MSDVLTAATPSKLQEQYLKIMKDVSELPTGSLVRRVDALGEKLQGNFFELGLLINRVKDAISAKDPEIYSKYKTFQAYRNAKLSKSLSTVEKCASAFRTLTAHSVPLEPVAELPTSYIPIIAPGLTAETYQVRLAQVKAPGMTVKKLHDLDWVEAAKNKTNVNNASGKNGQNGVFNSGPIVTSKAPPKGTGKTATDDSEAAKTYLKALGAGDALGLMIELFGVEHVRIAAITYIPGVAQASTGPVVKPGKKTVKPSASTDAEPVTISKATPHKGHKITPPAQASA